MGGAGQGDVFEDGHERDRSHDQRVLGNEAHTGVAHCSDRGAARLSAEHPLRARGTGSHAQDQVGQFALPVARYPGDADDLARVDLEIEVTQGGFGTFRRRAHPAKLERRHAFLDRRAIADVEAGKLFPKHEMNQPGFVGLRPQQRPGDAPLAQDGDAVGTVQHFAQLVCDEDDGVAVSPQVLEDFQ